jgi:hypothetical protein
MSRRSLPRPRRAAPRDRNGDEVIADPRLACWPKHHRSAGIRRRGRLADSIRGRFRRRPSLHHKHTCHPSLDRLSQPVLIPPSPPPTQNPPDSCACASKSICTPRNPSDAPQPEAAAPQTSQGHTPRTNRAAGKTSQDVQAARSDRALHDRDRGQRRAGLPLPQPTPARGRVRRGRQVRVQVIANTNVHDSIVTHPGGRLNGISGRLEERPWTALDDFGRLGPEAISGQLS